MQASNPTTPAVPIARGGPITTDMLEQVLPAARAAPWQMSDELGLFMIANFAPLIEELIQRRRQMSVIFDVANPDNVVELWPGSGLPNG